MRALPVIVILLALATIALVMVRADRPVRVENRPNVHEPPSNVSSLGVPVPAEYFDFSDGPAR